MTIYPNFFAHEPKLRPRLCAASLKFAQVRVQELHALRLTPNSWQGRGSPSKLEPSSRELSLGIARVNGAVGTAWQGTHRALIACADKDLDTHWCLIALHRCYGTVNWFDDDTYGELRRATMATARP
jgi:hypothetical protein